MRSRSLDKNKPGAFTPGLSLKPDQDQASQTPSFPTRLHSLVLLWDVLKAIVIELGKRGGAFRFAHNRLQAGGRASEVCDRTFAWPDTSQSQHKRSAVLTPQESNRNRPFTNRLVA